MINKAVFKWLTSEKPWVGEGTSSLQCHEATRTLCLFAPVTLQVITTPLYSFFVRPGCPDSSRDPMGQHLRLHGWETFTQNHEGRRKGIVLDRNRLHNIQEASET